MSRSIKRFPGGYLSRTRAGEMKRWRKNRHRKLRRTCYHNITHSSELKGWIRTVDNPWYSPGDGKYRWFGPYEDLEQLRRTFNK